MRSAGVVEIQVAPQVGLGIGHRVVSLEIDLLVLDAFPESFDKDVVTPAALAIHADPDSVILQQPGEIAAGELATLIGVEDIRLAETRDGFADRLQTEIRGQRVG